MRTPDSPAIVARLHSRLASQMLPGTVLSFTTVLHPPKGFPDHPRVIGLIELNDGKRVIGSIIASQAFPPIIGRAVAPCMRLSRINEQGLRLYEVAYTCTAQVTEPLMSEQRHFPGYILALTGPSGVGKTTISTLIVKAMGDFTAKVPIVTSRAPKEGDEQEYDYVTAEEFGRLQRNGDLATWTRIPSASEERHYGYRRSDIAAIWSQGKLPVVVTEMHLLQGLSQHFGRRSVLSLGLLPPGHSKRAMLSQLLHRLRIRGRETVEQIEERLKHAQEDLDFFTRAGHLFDHILVNEDLDTVLQTIKGHVLALVKA